MPLNGVMLVETAAAPTGRGAAPRLTALEHVANRPIVHHVLDRLADAGVRRLIVAGESDALLDIRACLRAYERPFAEVDYALCPGAGDLPGALAAVTPLVGDAPCVVHPADGLLGGRRSLVEHGSADADLVVFAALPTPTSTAAGVPELGVFGRGALRRCCEALTGRAEADFAALAQGLAAGGADVCVRRVDGWCRYRGGGHELLELNRFALEWIGAPDLPPLPANTRLEGPALIDPTAEVRDSVIVGPVVIGPHATVSEAYIGPYTSIGAGARIEGTEIERSIVAAGASVMYVGGRLVSSLLGRDARVFKDFSLPRAMRLWVGDGDEVALC